MDWTQLSRLDLRHSIGINCNGSQCSRTGNLTYYMKIIQALFRSCIVSSTFLAVSSIAMAQEMKSAVPRVFSIDGRTLAETKRRIQSGDKSFAAALTNL